MFYTPVSFSGKSEKINNLTDITFNSKKETFLLV